MVVADEPVSALDVSVQAAVIDLLLDIQASHDTTLLFISHDLSLVRYLADNIIVMYLGRIMEQGITKNVFAPPPITTIRYKDDTAEQKHFFGYALLHYPPQIHNNNIIRQITHQR